MSEEVKYKVGDEVLLKATVKELSEYLCTLDFGLLGKTIQYQATIAQMDINKKVKIPQFVADIIVSLKKQDMALYDALNTYSFDDDCDEWIAENSETFARAWLDGYEVEKEKKYKVYLKHTNQELLYYEDTDDFYFDHINKENITKSFTKQELIDAGFGDVFDNEMFEVVEVE